MDVTALGVAGIRKKLDAREISAPEVSRAFLDRISAIDGGISAFLTVPEERAMEDAARAQAVIDSGAAGPLTGIPVALKDNMVTKGVRTTCASKIIENWVPQYSGTLELKLREAGTVLLGKTNMDEFAMGASTEFSGFFPTRNPWDTERVPGGSSGGSAAAVAAGMAPIAFGSDTGGSVRQPAALCGVVGMKPTYGRVSRYGLVAFSSSLDQIGPFGRTVEDALLAFEASFGRDELDSTTVERPYDGAAARNRGLRGKRIGVPAEMFSEAVDPEVAGLVRALLDKLSGEGVGIEEFSAPMIEHGVSTYYIIAPAEASSNLARYDGVRYGLRVSGGTHVDMMKETRAQGFGREVKERIIIGTYVLSSGYYEAYYAKAHQVRTLMKKELAEAFEKYDAIIGPTSPTTAFKIGERVDDALALKIADYCTIPANIGGFPAISLNCGFVDGLPVGAQIVCGSFREDLMFGIAAGVEEILGPEARKTPEQAGRLRFRQEA